MSFTKITVEDLKRQAKYEKELMEDFNKYRHQPTEAEKIRHEINEFKKSISEKILDIYQELESISSKLK